MIPLETKPDGIKVWVVTHEVSIMGNMKEPATVVGVFSTEDREDKFIEGQQYRSDYDKREFTLDNPEWMED